MKIAIVTLFDQTMSQIGDLTLSNKTAYAKRHGYELKIFTKSFCPERATSWSKLKAIAQVLPDFDYVFWTDADSVITDMNQRLEDFIDPDVDLVVGGDWTGSPNCGNFIIHNCPEAFEFMKLLWDCPKNESCMAKYLMEAGWEQACLIHLLSHDWSLIRFKNLGEFLNANYWQSGRHFISHPYGSPLHARMEYLDEIVNPGQSFHPEKIDLFLAQHFRQRKGRFIEFTQGRDDEGAEWSVSRKLARLGWRGHLIGDTVVLSEQWRGFNSLTFHDQPPIGQRYEVVHLANVINDPVQLACTQALMVVCSIAFTKEVKLLGFPVELHRTDNTIILARARW